MKNDFWPLWPVSRGKAS